jgi:hypothetical protein
MSTKLNEETKQSLNREMPEDFQLLYQIVKRRRGVDLWDALED